MSSSSSLDDSSSKSESHYDVFITLRDTKHPVKALLESSLRVGGIKAFFDDDEHMEELLVRETLERSTIVVVIFTPKFLKSDVSIERLEDIMKYRKSMGKPVLPVFCGVNQLQVRKFVNSHKRDRHRALLGVNSLSGFTLSADFSNDKKEISDLIARLDEYLFRCLPQHEIALQLRVKEVLRLLKMEYLQIKDVIIIGIWGLAGIGKTTISKSIYGKIGDYFECKIFLEDIKDVWEKENGPILRKQLLSFIYRNKVDEINDVELTLQQMDQALCKRALVVLDNVSQVGQLMELCGNRKGFGEGSLIFITTRNKYILDEFVDESYKMKELNTSESLSLFSWHAFKNPSPTREFVNLSKKIMTSCEGLPLALEVIGSLLRNKTKPEWKQVWEKMKGIEDGQIQQKLKVSLDLLTDSEKDLFFNIACLYVGQSEHYVVQLLKGSRYAEIGMHVIFERNLVKVLDGKIYVHDCLQDIGREMNPSKPRVPYSYDVFLSFRGEDTRKSFTTHLCNALKQAGIEVFMDEENIERGENISVSLLEAIESSRISIIILSKNYARSSWCLQELEKIMNCHKTTCQEVLPIFYDVRPSEIRKQQSLFIKTWERLIWKSSNTKGMKLTTSFKQALVEAANLSGWDMQNYRTETELIDNVVETAGKKLDDDKYLFVANHPVGLKSRVEDIVRLLCNVSNEVIIAGIWGMGGIGKTTMAKAIYNEIGKSFEGKCFLANVKEIWRQDKGQVYLQEQLLSGIFKSRRMTLPNVEIGKTLIKEKLCKKRLLLVLDDVDHEEQLKALCGSREWFGQGSRIIITTRDKRLLQILQVVDVYNVREMDDSESNELFCWHAFKQVTPERDLIELSRMVVSYSGGLPLALEILGSYLFDRQKPYWESVLKKLQQIPIGQIYDILKISYDGLGDQSEKDIFLDICCFFIGKDISYVTQILNGCGLNAEIGITHLIERSLVKVVKGGNNSKLDMHDLLRDMGREIIRKHSPEEPEKRTRLWLQEDVINVLVNNTGTINIKGLALNMSRNNSISLNTKAFEKMRRLHLLQLDNVQLAGDYSYLSKELRWLCWHGFPLQDIPMNLIQEKVVAIDLRWSKITKAWEKSQLLEGLKILNLSHCYFLTETPNFSNLLYLEKLILKDCPCLDTIHPSIGDLNYIVLINLKDCKGLNCLPRNIYKLKSLRTLNLSGCSKIEKLEEGIEQMESLTTLVANQTAITQMPFSLLKSKSIKYLSLGGYEGLARDVFPLIALSWMSTTLNHSKPLFQSFGNMSSLIKGLSHPLSSRRHQILDTRPSTSQASSEETHQFFISFADKVVGGKSNTFMCFLSFHIGEFNKATDTLLKNISQGLSDGGLGYSLPRDNYPDWLVFENEGSSVLFKMPQVVGYCFKGMVLNIIIYSSRQDSMTSVYPVGVLIKNFTKGNMDFYKQDHSGKTSFNEEQKKLLSNLEPGNEVEVIVNFAHKYIVQRTTIYVQYVEETNWLSVVE